MPTSFEKLNPNSRIWIYQANRILSDKEQEDLLQQAESFTAQWVAHGRPLMASTTILHDYFLIIAVDETFGTASGCSIDSAFQFVRKTGSNLNIDFFQRTNLAFLIKGVVQLIQTGALKQAVEKGKVSTDTAFFNNNIQTKAELRTKWVVHAGESWLKRYFHANS